MVKRIMGTIFFKTKSKRKDCRDTLEGKMKGKHMHLKVLTDIEEEDQLGLSLDLAFKSKTTADDFFTLISSLKGHTTRRVHIHDCPHVFGGQANPCIIEKVIH